MTNMAYCRFQNTAPDLRDCQEALDQGDLDDLSTEERRAALQLIRSCVEVAADYGHLLEAQTG